MRLRHVVLNGLASLSFGLAAAPSSEQHLSSQRPAGPVAAANANYDRLNGEALALTAEFKSIEYTENALATARQSLPQPQQGQPQTSLAQQIRDLAALNDETVARRQAYDKKIVAFHQHLADDRSLSEAEISGLYTGPFEGTVYTYYYTETLAYRDECRAKAPSDTDACMTRMEDTETLRRLPAVGEYAGGAFGLSLLGMFGASAAGGYRRRRQDSRGQKLYSSTADLLKPKGR